MLGIDHLLQDLYLHELLLHPLHYCICHKITLPLFMLTNANMLKKLIADFRSENNLDHAQCSSRTSFNCWGIYMVSLSALMFPLHLLWWFLFPVFITHHIILCFCSFTYIHNMIFFKSFLLYLVTTPLALDVLFPFVGKLLLIYGCDFW